MGKYKFAICLSLFLTAGILLEYPVYGQQQFQGERYNNRVDFIPVKELRELLSKATSDTSRINHHLDIAQHYIFQKPLLATDVDSAGVHLKSAWRIAADMPSKRFSYQVMLVYAKLYHKQKLPRNQMKAYMQATSFARQMGNKLLEAEVWYYSVMRLRDNDGSSYIYDYRQRVKTAYQLFATYGKSSEDHSKEAFLLKELADFDLNDNKLDPAVQKMLAVIKLHKTYHLRDLEYAYDLLSAVYDRRGELSKSLYYALESVKTVQARKEVIPDTFLNRLASAYESIGKTEESIFWYSKSYNSTPKNSPYLYVPAYALASQYIKQGQVDKALALTKKTWNEFSVRGHDMDSFMFLAFEESYTAKKQFRLAQPYIKKLLEVAAEEDLYPSWKASIYFSVSNFYFAQKMYAQALTYALKALPDQQSMTLPRQIQLNETLYKIDLAMNRPADAFDHFQAYHNLRDSIFSQQNLNTIERLQVEFKTSQKENENEILTRKSQLQNQELGRLQVIKNSTIALLICVSIVLLLLYGRFRLKKKHHAEAARQKAELDIAYSRLETSVLQKNQLLEDKERLIREVHHRVKNNLQLTMSLLNSQSYYLEDASAIAAIRESQHRLKSIALIHQKLYQSDIVSMINIHPYIVELISYLRDSLSDGKKIRFELDITDLNMDIAAAVPLGLFINEAITNCFKYAFPDHEEGLIEVSLKPGSGSRYELRIRDNGIGLPENFDQGTVNTMGMTLMNGLSGQMDAELSIFNASGLVVHLVFENRESLSTELT